MSCALFDIGCRISQALAPFWFWIMWGGIALGALVALGVLYKVKVIAGWPGVAALAGVAVYLFGFFRGRAGKSINPVDLTEVDSAGNKLPTRPRPRPKRRFNADTNTWENL